jgi:hypothetical protein
MQTRAVNKCHDEPMNMYYFDNVNLEGTTERETNLVANEIAKIDVNGTLSVVNIIVLSLGWLQEQWMKELRVQLLLLVL